jgi:autotransporter-associated beta strand protein
MKPVLIGGIAALLLATLAMPAHAANRTWNGGGTTNNVSDAANWGGTAPINSDTLFFGGATRLTPTLTANLTATGITFNNGAGAFVLGGASTFTILGTGITNMNATTETINTAITFGAAQTWKANTGALVFGGPVANGGFLLTVGGNFNTTIGGALSGTGGLSMTGAGTLTLNGPNTLTGTTTLSAGTTVIGNATAFGTGTLLLAGGTVAPDASARTIGNAITLTASSTVGGSQNLVFNGLLTETASTTLMVNNSALATFAGGMQLTSGNRTRTLTISGTGNTLVSGVIKDGPRKGSLKKTGTGTLTLANANTYTGKTTLTAGTLALGNNAALGTGGLTLNGGTLQASGAGLSIGNATSLAVSSTLSGSQNLTFTGSFTATNNAVLTLAGTGLTTLSGAVAFGAKTVTLAGTGNVMISGAISGSNTLTQTTTGTVTITGTTANTRTGATVINAGTMLLSKTSNAILGALTIGDGTGTDTLRLGASNQISDSVIPVLNASGVFDLNGFNETLGSISGSGSVTGAGTLTLNANTNTNCAVLFTGASALVKSGTGILTLQGASTSTGGVTINNGTVAYGVTNAISASSAVNLTGAGILDFANFNGGLLALNMSAGLVKTGTGTLTLGSGGVQATSSGGAAAQITGKLALSTNTSFAVNSGGAATDLSLAAIVSGNASVTKAGAGTLLFSGLNTYTGATQINAGKLQVSGGNAIPDSSAVVLANAAGASLDLAASETIASLAGGGALGGNVTLGANTLTTGGDNSSTTFSGVLSGTGGLTKAGTGTFTLTGSNTYTGTTTINAGVLRPGSASGLSASSTVSLANASGVALDLNGFDSKIGGLAGGGASGGNVALGTATLTVGGNNASTSYTGVIGGAGGLIKTGTGTLTLNAAQTLTGQLNVTGGTLALAAANGTATAVSSIILSTGGMLSLENSTTENANRLGNATPISFQGGTLRFASDSNGSTETVGALIPQTGSSSVVVVHNGTAAQTTSLTFSSLGTIGSGTISFSATGGTLGAAATGPHVFITGQANGFIGGWATVGTDFAEYSTNGVRIITGYFTGASGINVNDPTGVVLLASASPASATTLTNAGTTTDRALNLADSAAVNLGSDPTRTLNLLSGGLLKAFVQPTTISGAGRLTAGGTAAGTLFTTVDAGSTLTINAPVIDNAGPNGLYGDGDDGAVSMSKSGAAVLVLGGTNTFTGGTIINGGVLRIGADANLGAASGGVTFRGGSLNVTAGFTAAAARSFSAAADMNGTFDIDTAQTLTLGSLQNRLTTGSTASHVIKAGNGTLIIPGANPGFDGTLDLNAGTVELRDAGSLGDAVNRGAITLNGGTLALRGDTSTNFLNDVTATTASTVSSDRLTGTSPAVVHTLGLLTIGATTLNFAGTGPGDVAFARTALTGAATFNPTTADANLGAVTGAFGFTKTGGGTLLVGAGSTYTGSTTISAGTFALAANNAGSSFSAVTLAAGATFDLNGFSGSIGSLAGSGSVALGSGTLTSGFDNTSTTFSGVIGGIGGLTKTGTGTLTLSGANTYTGATTIGGGTLQLGTSNVIANNSAVVFPATSSGIFDLNGFSETVGSIEGGGDILLGAGTLTVGGTNASTLFSGMISGTGGLVKNGTGTLTLDDASTYTGATAINAGALLIQHPSALGGTNGGTTVAAGAELQIAGDIAADAEPLTLNGAGVSGAGALRNLSDINTVTGPVTLASNAAIGADSGALTVSGSLNAGANTLTIVGAGDVEITGLLSGTGASLVKNGPGLLSLTNANTYTGATNVLAGTLHIENNAALGATAAGTIVAAGATLEIEDATGFTVTGEALTLNGTGAGGNGALRNVNGDNVWTAPITLASNSTIQVDAGSFTPGAIGETGGPRSLTKTGDGTLIFSAAQTYTGATEIQLGTLQLTAAERISNSSAVIVLSAASFDMNGFSETVGSLAGGGDVDFGTVAGTVLTVGGDNSSTEFSGSLSGTGSLVKSGSGTLTLSGASSYTGSTTINSGTLAITGNDALGAGGTLTFNGGNLQLLAPTSLDRTVVLNAPATLVTAAGADVVISGSLNGSATLTKEGPGTLVIAGAGATPVLVADGTLSVTGSNTGFINVGAGGILAGTGTTSGVAVQNGGTLSPGPLTATLNTGNLSLQAISDYHVQIAGPGAGEYDSVNVTGSVTLAGNLTGELLGGFVPAGVDPGSYQISGPNFGLQKFFIVVNDGADTISGLFANQLTAGNPFGGAVPTIFIDGQMFAISYTGDSVTNSTSGGNDVVLVALIPQPIPEPAALATLLAGSALLGLAHRPRRRR